MSERVREQAALSRTCDDDDFGKSERGDHVFANENW